MSKYLPGSHSFSSPTMIKMNVLFHIMDNENTGENQTQGVERKIQSIQQSDVAFMWIPGAKAKEGRRQE